MDSGRSVAYSYDALYRLTSAVTNGSANYTKWGLSWTYDRYGNALAETQSYDSPAHFSVSVDATTNRITGSPYAYDANGNMTDDGANTLVYDAENRVVSASNGNSSGTYAFDGNSLRVKKVSGSTTTVYIFSGSKVIAEYDNSAAPASPTREYLYAGSQLLANIVGGVSNYFHPDHLSNRLWTDATTGNVNGQRGHYPFGETWYESGSITKWKFTSYERDAETSYGASDGTDYALARSYVNRLARFSSPDPISGSPSDPQSLNKYSYTFNDPINLADPSGFTPKLDAPAMDPSTWNSWLLELFFDASGGLGLNEFSSGYGSYPIITGEAYWTGEDWMSTVLDPGALFSLWWFGGSGNTSGDPIGATLEKLQKLLKLDPNCSSFLSSNGTNAQTELSGIIENHLYGQTEIPPTPSGPGTLSMTNAVSFGYIPGQAITVNTIGAFFNSTYNNLPLTTDRGRIAGGTPAAQGFILLHELGHLTDVLKPDFNKQKVVDQNDKALEGHCKDLIKALSK